MASKVEQQYKVLNAELMDHVQKQRIELGMYKKEVVALKRENMELQQAHILENYRQRQDHIGLIRSLMRRMDIDLACLAESTERESIVDDRRGQRRRSSKEMCQEMRQSSALASSTRTVSPTRHRDTPAKSPNMLTTSPQRASEIENDRSSALAFTVISEETHEESTLMPTTPQSVVQKANDSARASALAGSPKIFSPTRRRGKNTEKPIEAPRLAPRTPQRVLQIANGSASALAGSPKIFSPTRRRGKNTEKPIGAPRLAPTTPQRVLQIAMDRPSALAGSPQTCPGRKESEEPNEEPTLTHSPSLKREEDVGVDGSSDEEIVVDDSLAGTIMADYSLGLDDSVKEEHEETSTNDSSFENYSPPRRPLRAIDQNVTARSQVLTRSKGQAKNSLLLDKDNSTKEQPSVEIPRLVLTPASPMRGDSPMGSPSFRSEASKLRRSLFEGNFLMRASNTSTPIANRSSPEHITTAKETSEILSRSRMYQPTVRIRKLKSEPGQAEQTDLSTTRLSSNSSRPSRKCRPTKLSEPNLKDKMRNSSVGKKKSSE